MGGDTLTCGVCRKDFALADIVKFIQHKVLTCNKENYQCGRTAENGAAGGDNSPATGAHTPVASSDDLTSTATTMATSTATSSLPGSGTAVTRRHSNSTTTAVPHPPSSALTPPSGKSSPLIGSSGNNNNHLGDLVKAELEGKQKSAANKAECVDADTNTVNSGRIMRFYKQFKGQPIIV